MVKLFRCPDRILRDSIAIAMGLIAGVAAAQTQAITSKFVPDDAIAVVVASPVELMQDPSLAMFPIEIFQVQAKEQLGIDIMDLASIKVVVGMPTPSGPQFGVVVETSKDYEIAKLSDSLFKSRTAAPIDGINAYLLAQSPDVYLHQVDSRHFVAANPTYLKAVVTAENGTGPLPTLVGPMPRFPGITLVATLKTLRPMLSGLAQQQSRQLPPSLQPLGLLPDKIEAIRINTNVGVTQGSFKTILLCDDEAAAVDVERILRDSMVAGRELFLAQDMQGGMSPAVAEATKKYMSRMADEVMKLLNPVQNGRAVTLQIESSASIATTGVLVGLLLPAVQAAREAARRMQASNHLKQIMLAMHNYHAAYNHLPPPAIVDAAGKPLLSWRVAILPFVEQQALYEKFHLDEPWDSPHNLPLSQSVPEYYVDPSAVLPPGHTVFHAVIGEEIGLNPEGKTSFRDFLDGTSNSVMIFEAGREGSVVWSQPEDAPFDFADPLAWTGDSHQGGFHVGMADGAIKFVTNDIDRQLFVSLLTRAAGD